MFNQISGIYAFILIKNMYTKIISKEALKLMLIVNKVFTFKKN